MAAIANSVFIVIGNLWLRFFGPGHHVSYSIVCQLFLRSPFKSGIRGEITKAGTHYNEFFLRNGAICTQRNTEPKMIMQENETPETTPEKRHFDSVRDALLSGRDEACEKAKTTAPKLKSTVADVVHEIAYGAAFGAFFAGAFAHEMVPKAVKEGLHKGATAGKNAAKKARDTVRDALKPAPAPEAAEIIDIGPDPAGA